MAMFNNQRVFHSMLLVVGDDLDVCCFFLPPLVRLVDIHIG